MSIFAEIQPVMKTIRVKDKDFRLFITAEEIDRAVTRIAGFLNEDMQGENPVFLVILNGAFIFASDLFKKLDMPCEVSFVKLSSYRGTATTARVKELIGLNESLRGRHVVIVEDIIDTGITMDYLLRKLEKLRPAGIRIAALLFKPEAFQMQFHIDYIGIEVPPDFIVGYGLDYDGQGRNHPDIYKILKGF
jgi:hypoxanthine phosphoribosyltransferase